MVKFFRCDVPLEPLSHRASDFRNRLGGTLPYVVSCCKHGQGSRQPEPVSLHVGVLVDSSQSVVLVACRQRFALGHTQPLFSIRLCLGPSTGSGEQVQAAAGHAPFINSQLA